jgi:hypothetical protein
MYSEQFAIILLIAANGLAGQANLNSVPAARLPQGGAEQVSVKLKLDPRLNGYRNPYTRKIAQRKTAIQPALLARVD